MTMGPAPMIMMLFRSVRFGISVLSIHVSQACSRRAKNPAVHPLGAACPSHPKMQSAGGGDLRLTLACAHGAHETFEQRSHVVGTRTGFRMTLETKGFTVSAFEALQRAVEQRAMSSA